MVDRPIYFVVGGDSLVGAGLVEALTKCEYSVFASTRRRNTLTERRVFLDLEDLGSFQPPAGTEYAYIVAAATNYDRCENDPNARIINVELIPRLVELLLGSGVLVTFVSTNSVFGGEQPWPKEDDPHAPGIAYAQQKAEGEARIREAAERHGVAGRLNIVRLTKIMNSSVSPLPAWLSAWREGVPVEPFSDLIFAPMSVLFVSDALAQIGRRRIAGNLHLSGAANVTYVDFAHALARQLNIDQRLIRPTTASAKGIHIPFKPRFSGLSMERTTALTGIAAQMLDDVVEDVVSSPYEARS